MSKRYGWYSAKAADQFARIGPSVANYRNIKGHIVPVTTITDTPDNSNTTWDDIMYVGELGEYIGTSDSPAVLHALIDRSIQQTLQSVEDSKK
jgi:hypothetical protein